MNTNNKIIAGFTALSIAFLGSTAILQERTKIPPASMSANAAETYGDLTYIVSEEKTIAITDCDESATNVVIPSEINGIAVTSIEKDAFKFCRQLESVTIPNSITSIGDFAFYACSSLTSLTIPDSVIYISDDAFGSCSKLKSVKLSENIKYIHRFTFSSCKSLTSIIIPENVTYIDMNAFYNCTTLEEITILHPRCSIYENINTINKTATIYGYDGSKAQEYAEKYSHKFQSLGEIPQKFTTTTTTTTNTTTTTTTSTTSTTTTTTSTSTTSTTSTSTTYTTTSTTTTTSTSRTLTQTGVHSYSNSGTNTATTTTTAKDDRLLGDVNGDGFIDSVDATLIMSYYAYVSAYNGIGKPETFPEYLERNLEK